MGLLELFFGRGKDHWFRGSGYTNREKYSEWLRWLDENTEEKLEQMSPKQRKLHHKLLNVLLRAKGHHVLIPPGGEPDIEAIATYGFFVELPPNRMRLVPGEPSNCHGNAAHVWETDPDRYSIMTGYALSKDGLWRQHSWTMDNVEEQLVDSHERRLLYFGVEIPEEAAPHWHQQYA